VSYVFSVGGFAILTSVTLLWNLARPRSRAARFSWIVVVAGYTAASMRVVPWALSRPLVAGFKPFAAADLSSAPTAIVLLGAGTFTVHGRHQRLGVLDLSSAERVLEAAHVFRVLPSPPWIISSGGAADGFNIEPSGIVMKEALVRLGVPADRILVETQSRTTRDEAILVAPMLASLGARRAVLVTSDIHMRRALATFRAAGVDAVPALAIDPLMVDSRPRSILPTTEGLRFSGAVAHEYAGLIYYRARGWIGF